SRGPPESAPVLAKLHAFALVGIDADPVTVEVDVAPGLPKTVLVGLPEMAVRESVHRIERALVNLGYQRPSGRTVINLAPARHPPRKSAAAPESARPWPPTGWSVAATPPSDR